MGFLFLLGLFQGFHLIFGEDEAFLGGFGFQSLEALGEDLQVMAQPYAAHPARRNEQTLFFQFIGDAHLTEGRLVDRQAQDGFLHGLVHAVFHDGFAAADLLQRQLPAGLIQLAKPVEAIP